MAEGIGGEECVGGRGGGRDGDCVAAGGAYCGGNDDVVGAGDLPGQSDRGAGGDRGGAGGKASDGGIGARGDVGIRVQRRQGEDIEIGRGGAIEEMEVAVVPTIVGCAGDVHSGTVVGEDEAVFFHGVEDDLVVGGIAGDIEAGLQAKTCAHGRSVGVRAGGSPVRGGGNKTSTGIGKSETNGMVDGANGDFIVTN